MCESSADDMGSCHLEQVALDQIPYTGTDHPRWKPEEICWGTLVTLLLELSCRPHLDIVLDAADSVSRVDGVIQSLDPDIAYKLHEDRHKFWKRWMEGK